MNVENIKRLRDFLAVLPPERFNMGVWSERLSSQMLHTCGTCACIGGWAEALFYSPDEPAAQDILGLSDDDADDLFYPNAASFLYSEITPTHAVRVLDHLAATGEVDWSVGFAEESVV